MHTQNKPLSPNRFQFKQLRLSHFLFFCGHSLWIPLHLSNLALPLQVIVSSLSFWIRSFASFLRLVSFSFLYFKEAKLIMKHCRRNKLTVADIERVFRLYHLDVWCMIRSSSRNYWIRILVSLVFWNHVSLSRIRRAKKMKLFRSLIYWSPTFLIYLWKQHLR